MSVRRARARASLPAVSLLVASLLTVSTLAVGLGGASAQAVGAVGQPHVVSAVPSPATPNINDGQTLAIAQVGSRVVLGGTFTSVSPPGVTNGSGRATRRFALAFDPATGQLDNGFLPAPDGTVWDAWPGPSADTVYLAGEFTTVGGSATRGIALVSTVTGRPVATFRPPALNGIVYSVRLSGGHLFVGGSFTTVGGVAHAGIATLNPTTGALDPYVTLQLTGHHNDAGAGAQGGVGARKMAVSPDGSRLIVIGNFKRADGALHDQIVNVLIGSRPAATIDPSWDTAAYSSLCFNGAFDTYMQDVDFAPDGSYFVVGATGGAGINTDGTNSLCDSAARWDTGDTGSDVRPVWVDYTGRDTIASVAVTGTAVYVGGHQRWLNNPLGADSPAAGAVPRPGLGALDPASGVPLSWNPGRNPRGSGAASLLATANGLYVGSDTASIGDHAYYRGRIAFFPLAGGGPAPTYATPRLPADVYLAGSLPHGDTLGRRSFTGTSAGTTAAVNGSGAGWGNVRGAFMVGGTLFYGWSDGNLYRRSFDGVTFGPATLIDPYDDPAWDDVQTGSGQTYRGEPPGLYGSEMLGVTSMFYAGGRLYFTRAGHANLYSRAFSPESGIVAEDEAQAGGVDLGGVAGGFLSGSTYYYADGSGGALHSVTFTGGALVPGTDRIVTGPGVTGVDWRARGLFLFMPGLAPGSTYTALAPCRVFDTRSGTGSCAGVPSPAVRPGPVGAGGTLSVRVTGLAGVPANATAVVLNLTAVGATRQTVVTMWPHGVPQPTTATLTIAGSAPRSNLAFVPVGSGGAVDVANLNGSVHLVADLAGYFSPAGASTYTPLTPCRVLDTRNGQGRCPGARSPAVAKAKVGPRRTLVTSLTGVGGVPANATAVVLNVTAVNATASTFVTAFPDGTARPIASNLNADNARAVPNLVVVRLGAGGRIDLYNNQGSVDLVVDLAGYFGPTGTSTFRAVGPCRVFDTRSGAGACPGTGAGYVPAARVGATPLKVRVTGIAGVPSNATAVVLNVTAVDATDPTVVTVYPFAAARPEVANLNVYDARAVPNLVVVRVGPGGYVDLANTVGAVDLIADLAGWFGP